MIALQSVKVFYRVDWLLDDLLPVPTEDEMKYRYKERAEEQGAYIEMANFMRKNTRQLIPNIFNNSSEDVIVEAGGMVVAASPPRPYEEWAYDCAKSDIVVSGPQKMRETVIQRLQEEKRQR